MYFPYGDRHVYIIQTYSHIREGEELSFKYYDSKKDKVVDCSENVVFENFMNIGDAFNTFQLNTIPDDFGLNPAYPNPFNPATTLTFSLPVDCNVVLSIYDTQGRQVSNLIDGELNAGYHSISWNASSYASGIYFVKMEANEFVNTQKIIFIK